MTFVDLAFMLIIVIALWSYFKHRAEFVQYRIAHGPALIITGLVLIGMFSLAGLVILIGVYWFPTQSTTMAVLRNLHLRYSWIAMLLGAVCILAGLEISIKQLFPLITRARLKEQLLQKREKHSRRVLSVANEGTWDWDLKTNSTIFDARYYTLSGYEPNEFPATFEEWKKRIHPDDVTRAMRAVKQYLAGERETYDVEFRFRHQDGHYMWIRARGKIAARDARGVPTDFVGTHADITVQKRSEQALRRIEKMDAIGQLTGGIAHDFNNLLGIILGNLELLDGQLPAESPAHKRLETINRTIHRATRLTQQLLGFSRRHAAQIVVTDLNRRIVELESLIDRSLTPQIEVQRKLAADLWLTAIDPDDFDDALLNLLINARDAMDGRGRLTLETGNCVLDAAYCAQNPATSPGEYIQLTVSDTGTGVPLELQEHIFEPFFTTKPQGQGTGLGLTMAYGFAQRSGGSIKLYSESGIGTTLHLYLPRSQGELPVAEVSKEVPSALPRGRETLLVVDDEEELRKLAQETLQALGYQVVTADNGPQALVRLHEKPAIALLCSDVVMPGGINGYELAEQATAYQPDLKVLLTSGFTGQALARNGQARFAANLLNKPYTQDELARRVRALLDQPPPTARERDAAGAPPTPSAIEWTPDLSVGIEALDSDHRVLLELSERIQLVEASGDQPRYLAILGELLDCAEHHFPREEAVMAACDYPFLRQHRQVHRFILEQIRRQQRRLHQGTLCPDEWRVFVASWWRDHIQTMDRAYGLYCRGKAELIEQALAQVGSAPGPRKPG